MNPVQRETVTINLTARRHVKSQMLRDYEAERAARLAANPYKPFFRSEVPEAFRRERPPAKTDAVPTEQYRPDPALKPVGLPGHPF